jgi:hypothetical protein
MWDVFEKDDVMTERDVIKQREMLMELSHVANVGHERHVKFSGEQTYRKKLADAGNTNRVRLNKSSALRLEIIFEDDAVRDVFANREFRRRDGVSEGFVAEHIVGVRGFFDPERIDGTQALADIQCLRQGPLLVRIHHDARCRSRSASREPTFNFIAVKPAAMARLQFSRTCWSS